MGSQNFTLRTFWLAKFYFAHFLARKILLCALFGSQNVVFLPFTSRSHSTGFDPSFWRKIAPERGFAHKNWLANFFLRTFWLAEFVLFALFGSRFFTSCYLLFVTYLLFVIFLFCLKLHCLLRLGKKQKASLGQNK
jgi:hypothetical protein